MNANPYGLINLWQQGDIVTRIVALMLLGMSVISWYVIVTRALNLRAIRKQAEIACDAFWQARSLDEGLRLFAPLAHNPFRLLAEEAMGAADRHALNRDNLHGMLNLSDWLNACLRRSVENITHQLQSGLSVLASIGSTAPFVGLFGTVWGIYHALVRIGISGESSIDKVAGPVGEALIMTALGLGVAIPAVLGYNALTRGNRNILARARNFAHDLHACLLMGEPSRKPAVERELAQAGGRP